MSNKERIGGDVATEYAHPEVFGLIKRHTVNGEADLFGTNAHDNSFVELEINEGVLQHHLNRDWYHDRSGVLKLRMSKSQWATFISTSNGSGTPCAITMMRDGEFTNVPAIKGSFNMRDQIESDAERIASEALKVILDGMKELKELL